MIRLSPFTYTTILSLLCLFVFAGCSSEIPVRQPDGTGPAENGTDRIGIQAYGNMSTRLELMDNWSTRWSENDIIGVFMEREDGSRQMLPYETKASDIDDSSALFTGGLTWQAASENHTFYAYYPYATNEDDPTNINVHLSDTQTQTGQSFAHLAACDFLIMPPKTVMSPASLSSGQNIPMQFKHAFTVIELRIKSEFETQVLIDSVIVFSSLGPISVKDGGWVDISQPEQLGGGEDNAAFARVRVKTDTNANNFVKLRIAGSASACIIPNDGTDYFPAYMMILPGNHLPEIGDAKSISITVYTNNNGSFSILKQGIDFKRGQRHVAEITIKPGSRKWDGVSRDEPARGNVTVTDGSGKQVALNNAYIIETANELAWALGSEALSIEPWRSKHLVLNNDIDLDNHPWTPITDFYGHIYGQGHTIANLHVVSDRPNVGLIEKMTQFSTSGLIIDRLHVTGSIVSTATTGATYVGGILGTITGSSYETVSLNDVSFNGTVAGSAANSENITGGLVGNGACLVITNCNFIGAVSGYTAGGIIGTSSKGVTTLSGPTTNMGTITGVAYAGGLMAITGLASEENTIRTSINYGTVTATGDEGIAGGIIAYCPDEKIRLISCRNMGATIRGNIAGGIIGKDVRAHWNMGYMETSYNTGDIFGGMSPGGYAGGLVGYGQGHYTDSYNTGNITGYVAGGLGGYDASDSSSTRCFNWGNITGGSGADAYAGGLIGQSHLPVTILNSYNSGDVEAWYAGGLVGKADISSVTHSYVSGTISAFPGGTYGQVNGNGSLSGATVSGSYSKDDDNRQGMFRFGPGSWPNWPTSVDVWRRIGGWNDGNPEYPRLGTDPRPW